MSAPDCLMASTTGVKSWLWFGVALVEHRRRTQFLQRELRALPPAVPNASVECSTAHFFLPSVLTP